jgi:inositol-phosphate transport system permease protein
MTAFQTRWAGILALMLAITFPIVLGYVWLVINSVNTDMRGLIPAGTWSIESWRFLWQPIGRRPMIWSVLINTLIFAGAVSLLVVFISAMAAYAISRLHFKGRGLFLGTVLALHAFPAVSLLISTFYVLVMLRLFDTLFGVTLVMTAFMMPLGIWLLKGFFDNLSWDMEMAALVDGASRFRIFFQIALPLAKPGLFALGIFSFLIAWGEFILPYTFIASSRVWVFSIYLESLIGDMSITDYGLMTAVGVFYTLPAAIIFLLGQRYLLQMYYGGSKG